MGSFPFPPLSPLLLFPAGAMTVRSPQSNPLFSARAKDLSEETESPNDLITLQTGILFINQDVGW